MLIKTKEKALKCARKLLDISLDTHTMFHNQICRRETIWNVRFYLRQWLFKTFYLGSHFFTISVSYKHVASSHSLPFENNIVVGTSVLHVARNNTTSTKIFAATFTYFHNSFEVKNLRKTLFLIPKFPISQKCACLSRGTNYFTSILHVLGRT